LRVFVRIKQNPAAVMLLKYGYEVQSKIRRNKAIKGNGLGCVRQLNASICRQLADYHDRSRGRVGALWHRVWLCRSGSIICIAIWDIIKDVRVLPKPVKEMSNDLFKALQT
jgi:hypothetical protein